MEARVPTTRVRALIVVDGRLVVSSERRRGRRHVSLPGGRVRFGEPLVEALAREVSEETSLEVEVGPLAYVAEVIRPHRRHDLNLIFVADSKTLIDERGLVLVNPSGRGEASEVLPPILDWIPADLRDGWPPPVPRWLGNVYRSEGEP